MSIDAAARLGKHWQKSTKPTNVPLDALFLEKVMCDCVWREIETAPKDGTKFLAWRRHSTLPLIVHYNDEYSQCEDVDGILVYGLTHWMPLPKAPTMQEDKP